MWSPWGPRPTSAMWPWVFSMATIPLCLAHPVGDSTTVVPRSPWIWIATPRKRPWTKPLPVRARYSWALRGRRAGPAARHSAVGGCHRHGARPAGRGLSDRNRAARKHWTNSGQRIDERLPTRPVVCMCCSTPTPPRAGSPRSCSSSTTSRCCSVVLVQPSFASRKGAIEHLLVMPVRPSRIAVAKSWPMAWSSLVAVAVSVLAIVKGLLAVPVEAPVGLFLWALACTCSLTALGILLAVASVHAAVRFAGRFRSSWSCTSCRVRPPRLKTCHGGCSTSCSCVAVDHYVKLARGILALGGWKRRHRGPKCWRSVAVGRAFWRWPCAFRPC